MSRYQRKILSAQKMIRKFADGRTCSATYPAVQIGGDRFDPIYAPPEVVENVPVVLLPRGAMNSDDFKLDTLLPETTHVVYLAGGDLPDKDILPGMVISSLGITHNVLSSDCWDPSGKRILHVVQVRT